MWLMILVTAVDMYVGLKKLLDKDDTCIMNFVMAVLLIAVMVVLQRL